MLCFLSNCHIDADLPGLPWHSPRWRNNCLPLWCCT